MKRGNLFFWSGVFIEATKWVIGERFLLFVLGITRTCSMDLASAVIAWELARYRDILLYAHEFTEELFNHYMQNENIKNEYALFSK